MEFRRNKSYSNKTRRKRNPKSKSTKPRKYRVYSRKNKLQKAGGDIETGVFHVVTIAIIAHGCVTTTIPSNNYNIRYWQSLIYIGC